MDLCLDGKNYLRLSAEICVLLIDNMRNKELADMFNAIGDALEFKGENPFKIIAYRKAARVLSDMTEDIESIHQQGKLREIPGIGEGIAKKIDEYLRTGKMKKYEEAKRDIPEGLLELLSIQSVGPKTLALAHKNLGVKNLSDFKKVASDGSLAKLPGMGNKKVENILKGMERFEVSKERISLGDAIPLVQSIVEKLKELKCVKDVSPAGSLRRFKETVGDIDILVTGAEGSKIIDYFTKLPGVGQILAKGETKGSVVMHTGQQVDVRVLSEDSYGAALQYFTGSKAHNIKLRHMARERGLKISEYGVFKGSKKIAGRIEEEVYRTLNLPWIPAELREDRGEIETAIDGKLPQLVEYEEIKGDLHVHSKYSDGSATIEELAIEAKRLGYEYIAICDHSKSVKYAGGLSEDRLLEEIEEIDRINAKLKGITVLKGTEVDILQNGKLDYLDSLLSKLDIVVAAIHTSFKKDCNKRMMSAMENPYVKVIAHPTGRLISSREGYVIDINEVIGYAAKTDTALEINAYYDRLDLNDVNSRKAKDLGVKLSIGTDAHHKYQLWMMKLGVGVARRGWLEKKDLLNTLSVTKLRNL